MLDLLKNCCNCFLLSLVKKHLNEHIIYCIYNLIISYWKKFKKLVKFITQSYSSLLNSFLFLSIFLSPWKAPITTFSEGFLTSLFLTNFSVNISFFYIQLFSTFFRVQSSQGPGFFRVRVQVLEVAKNLKA